MMLRRLSCVALAAAFAIASIQCTGDDPDLASPSDGDASSPDSSGPIGNDSGGGGDSGGNVDDASDAAPEGKPVWSALLGNASNVSVAVDANANVFLAVRFEGTNHLFGDKSLDAQGKDIAVLKLTSDGKTVTWAKRIGGTGDEVPTSLAVDPGGDVYVAGTFTSTSIDIAGGGTVTKGTSTVAQGFVARLSGQNGMGIWGSGFTITQSQNLDYSTCVDVRSTAAGLAFTCLFRGVVTYPGGSKTSNDRLSSLVGIINTTSGSVSRVNVVQSNTASSGGQSQAVLASASDVDADGNLYVVGQSYAAQLVVDGVAVAGSALRGSSSGFLVKLKPTGSPAVEWASIYGPLGAPGSANAQRVRVAGSDVYVSGTFTTADFGFGNVMNSGANDVFVLQVDKNGPVNWLKRFGGPNDDVLGGLDVDPSGRPFVAALFPNAPASNIDGKPVPAGNNVFVAMKMDPASGAALWVTGVETDGGLVVSDVASSPSNGHAVAAGSLDGVIDFDKTLTTSIPEVFVVDLSP